MCAALGRFEGSGDHRNRITREGSYAPLHLFSDSQILIANTNCAVYHLLYYLRRKLGLSKRGEEVGEGSDGQGSEAGGSSLAPKASCWP